MNTLLAALAAATLPLVLAAAATATETALPSSPVNEYDHIRTTLHGFAGPAAVLIPGMSTPGAVWDETVAALQGEMRLLVVEVRGFEGAPAPANAEPGVLPGIVADLAKDLAARGVDRAVVAGHSLGGLAGLRLALDHPDLTQSVVAIDALPFYATVFSPEATVESVAPQAERMRAMLVAQAGSQTAGAQPAPSGMSLDPEKQARIAAWSRQARPEVVAQALYEDLTTDLRQEIGRLEMPVTVLYEAARDPAIAAARYETDYAALAGVRLVPVERTAHFIMLDRPDVVQRAIAEAAGQS